MRLKQCGKSYPDREYSHGQIRARHGLKAAIDNSYIRSEWVYAQGKNQTLNSAIRCVTNLICVCQTFLNQVEKKLSIKHVYLSSVSIYEQISDYGKINLQMPLST